MKAINNIENIRLMDENNQVVKGAIFSNVHELWDDKQQQLTLILDPARVKSGLRANERLGRALIQGNSYRLVIAKMETVEHREVKPFEKKFMVGDLDTIAPSIEQWDIRFPQVRSTVPLRIAFPESVDLMSLYHRLTIANDHGIKMEGAIEIGTKEKQWTFTPMETWKKGNYTIYVNTRLADPSGNNLNGLFNHRVGSLNYEKEGETIEIPFSL